MEDQIVRKLTRQLRWLNIIVTFFGVVFLTLFILAGFLFYRAYGELHKAQNSISNIQERTSGTVNSTTDSLCSGLSSTLKERYGLCN